jgi:transposase
VRNTKGAAVWPRRLKVARFFADNPNYMRLLSLAQIAFGVWLASRQYREE